MENYVDSDGSVRGRELSGDQMIEQEDTVDILFSKIVDECRRKNTVDSYLNKISIVRGDFQDELFIQGEGEARARKLPKDLRFTSLTEIKSIDDPDTLLRLLNRICIFLENVQMTYRQLHDSIRELSVTIDEQLKDELIDPNPRESFNFARRVVDLAYTFECERLVTTRVSVDLFILCERRLSQLPKSKKPNAFERDVDLQMSKFSQLSTEVYESERDIKTVLKSIIRDYESQYMIHPYDMDLDTKTILMTKSQSSEIEPSDDDVSHHLKPTTIPWKTSSKRRENENEHRYASRKRKYDDHEQIIGDTMDNGKGKVSQIVREPKQDSSRRKHPVTATENTHVDNGWSTVCKSSKKSTWKDAFPGFFTDNFQSYANRRFEIQYKGDDFRVVEYKVGIDSRGHMPSMLIRCDDVNSMEGLEPRSDGNQENLDNHESVTCLYQNESKADIFNRMDSSRTSIVDKYLEFVVSNSSQLTLLYSYCREPNDDLEVSNVLESQCSQFYQSFVTSPFDRKLRIQSVFSQLSYNLSLIFRRIQQSQSNISSSDFDEIMSTHSMSLKSLRSYFIRSELSLNLVELLSSTWLEWKTNVLPPQLDPLLKSKSLLNQLSKVEEDDKDDMLICLILDCYFQMFLIVKSLVSKLSDRTDQIDVCSIRQECLHLLKSLFYDVYLFAAIDRKLLNLCLLTIMSNIQSKCLGLINDPDLPITLLSVANPDRRLGRFSRALSYIRLYGDLLFTLLNLEIELEQALYPKLEKSKLFEKLCWRTFNNCISESVCGVQNTDSQQSILSNRSMYFLTGNRSELTLDQQVVWILLCLHDAMCRSYVLSVNPVSSPIPDNWQFVNIMVAAFVDDVSSSLSCKMSFSVDCNINIQSDFPLKRVPHLMKVWSNPDKGIDVLLNLMHQLIKSSCNDQPNEMALVAAVTNIKHTNFLESCLDLIENEDFTSNLSETLSGTVGMISSLFKKTLTRSMALMSSLFRSLAKYDGILLREHIDLLLQNMSLNQAQTLFGDLKGTSIFKIISYTFEETLQSFMSIMKSQNNERSSARALRALRLSIEGTVDKIVNEIQKNGADLTVAIFIIKVMSVAIDFLGSDIFEQQSGMELGKSTMLKRILDASHMSTLSIDAKSSLDTMCCFYYVICVQGLFNFRWISTEVSNSDLNILVSNIVARSNIIIKWASSFISCQKENAFFIFVTNKKQHYMFLLSSLCYNLHNLNYVYNVLKSGGSLSPEILDPLWTSIIDLNSLIIHICTITLSTLEKLHFPDVLHVTMAASSACIDISFNYISQPLRESHQEMLKVFNARCRDYLVCVRSSLAMIFGLNRDSDNDTIFINQLRQGVESNEAFFNSIEKGKLSEVAVNVICLIVVLLELFHQHEIELTPFSFDQTWKDLMSLTLLPPQLSVSTSSKASDLWLQGLLSYSMTVVMKKSLNPMSCNEKQLQSLSHFLRIMGRSMFVSLISMSIASSIFPRQIVSYDPTVCVSNFATIIADNYAPNSQTKTTGDLLWIYVLYQAGMSTSAVAIDVVSMMFHRLTKYRRMWSGGAAKIQADPTIYIAQSAVESSAICTLAGLSTMDMFPLFKDLSRVLSNSISRILNHVKLCFSKNLIPFSEEYQLGVPSIIALTLYSCSEWNRDITNQLMKEMLCPYVLSVIKDHFKESFRATATFKCSHMMLQIMYILPLFIRTISTTPFTSTCTQWNVLLNLLHIAALRRFHSNEDMLFYQVMLVIWSLGLSIRSTSDFPTLIEYLKTRKIFAVEISLYDPLHLQFIEESIRRIGHLLVETIDDAGSPLLRHFYAENISMLQFRNYLLFSSGQGDHILPKCWMDAANDLLKSLNDSSHSVNELEFERMKLLVESIRVELFMRCIHIRTKMQALELSYSKAYYPPGTQITESLTDDISVNEHLTVIFSILIAAVKLIRYFLGEAPFILDQSLTLISSHLTDSIKDYQVVQETVQLIFIAVDSATFLHNNETNSLFNNSDRLIFSQLIADSMILIHSLCNILTGSIATAEIDIQTVVSKIFLVYDRHTRIRASQRLSNNIVNQWSNERPLKNVAFEHDLQMLKSKYDSLFPSRLNEGVFSIRNIVKRRIVDLLSSSYNSGPHCVSAITSKIMAILDGKKELWLGSCLSRSEDECKDYEKENAIGN